MEGSGLGGDGNDFPPQLPPAHPSTPPSLSPVPSTERPVLKYSPYKFDAPPVVPGPQSLEFTEIEPLKPSEILMATTSGGRAGPLLLAALESMGEAGAGATDLGAGGSSRDEGQSLSPQSYSNHSSERTSDTSVPDTRSTGSKSSAAPSSNGYSQTQTNYSHPTYSSLQHPLYSRPLAMSSSTYSLPPINRSSYTPYNYQSPYSRPLSSSGPNQAQAPGGSIPSVGSAHGSTTLPPINLAVLSANSEAMYRPQQSLASPVGATNPSSYAQSPSSLNPYNHPAYASAASHTYQHPAYARASISSASGPPQFAPPPPPPQAPIPSGSTNPYSHSALPPPTSASNAFAAPPSPWSGPPPPSLSITSGSALAKRRRSETTGLTLQNSTTTNGASRNSHEELEEQDELEDFEQEESEKGEPSKRVRQGSGETRSKVEDDEEGEAEMKAGEQEEEQEGDEEELAPQVKTSRPSKRARTTSTKADDAPAKDPQSKPEPNGSRASTGKSKGAARARTKSDKSKEPPEKKFICPHPSCGRAFARHFNLNSHIKSHQGIREFKCPECSKLFSRKHDCTRHCIAIHNYDKESARGPIHEPSQSSSSRGPVQPSPAPNSPPAVAQPLAPAALLLHASGTTTGSQPARPSLAMLLQQPSDTTTADAKGSPTSSTST